MESDEANNSLEQMTSVSHQSEIPVVEKEESVTSETSFAVSGSSHKMKIDELNGDAVDNLMEVDSISTSTSTSAKPNSKTNISFMIYL